MNKKIVEDMGIRYSYGGLVAMAHKDEGNHEMVFWDGKEWQTDDTEDALHDYLTAPPASDARLKAHGFVKND